MSWKEGMKGIAIVAALVFPLAVAAQNKEEEQPIVVVPTPEAKPEEQPPPSALIGLEAYREVLASGKYLVGPGDEFMISVTGIEEPFLRKVMAEGGLLLPAVGSVKVAGLSLKAAREEVEKAFARAFKQGQIAIELNKLRNFPVMVVGVVGRPGMTVASGVERISEILLKAGGLGSKASRRNIRIVKTGNLEPAVWERAKLLEDPYDYLRLSEVSQRVDLELYGVTGDSRYNPFVEDGDLIVVPPQSGQVGIVGAVQRGGFFEFVAGDRLSDLLILAQGLIPGYDKDRTELFRYTPDRKQKIVIPVDLEGVMNGDPRADLFVQSEDWLVVRQKPGYSPRSTVRIDGEVVYPGFYVVEKNRTKLREVIEWAGGFTEDASLAQARVIRQQAEGETKDPEFERIAAIPVADRTKTENQYFIMKSREKRGQMVVDFVALFEEGDETQNITLQPEDVIVVPPTPRSVIVSGQAVHPGAVVYDPSFTVMDYIKRAGGLSWRASKDIQVIKARTGEVKRYKEVDRVEPGDRIWIKEKPERDYWLLFTQTMGVIGEVTTVVLLYVTLTSP